MFVGRCAVYLLPENLRADYFLEHEHESVGVKLCGGTSSTSSWHGGVCLGFSESQSSLQSFLLHRRPVLHPEFWMEDGMPTLCGHEKLYQSVPYQQKVEYNSALSTVSLTLESWHPYLSKSSSKVIFRDNLVYDYAWLSLWNYSQDFSHIF
ncbi:hypothetical protein STEG23_003849, partial [Scotinomys teguina]